MRAKGYKTVETRCWNFVTVCVEHVVVISEGAPEIFIGNVTFSCDTIVPTAVPSLSWTPILSAQNKVVRLGDHSRCLGAGERFLRTIVIHIEDVAD